MANTPIVNAGLKYVNGLELAWTADETISMAAGAARDSANSNDIVLSAAVSISNATNGANGLDTGTVGANTMYAVYVIGDSTKYQSTAGLLSLASNSEPSLPAGYDMYRRVGWVLTDGTSDNLLFWQEGMGQVRKYFYDVGISELSGGSSTTYAAIDLATSVPPIDTTVILDIAYTPNSATNNAEFLPYGSSATNGIVRYGCGVAAVQVGQIEVPAKLNSSVPTIQYKVDTSDALTLLTVGFYDYMA